MCQCSNADSLAPNSTVPPHKIERLWCPDWHGVATETRYRTCSDGPTSPFYDVPKMCVNVESLLPRSHCRVLHVLRHGPPAARAVPDAAAAPLRRPVVVRRPPEAADHSLMIRIFASPALCRGRGGRIPHPAATAQPAAGSHALDLVLQKRNKSGSRHQRTTHSAEHGADQTQMRQWLA